MREREKRIDTIKCLDNENTITPFRESKRERDRETTFYVNILFANKTGEELLLSST